MKPHPHTAIRPCDGGVLLHKHIRPGAYLHEHVHEACALTLVLAGSYEEQFELGAQRCSGWQMQFKPAGIPHVTTAGDAGSRLFIVALDSPSLPEASALSALNRPVILNRGAATAIAITLFGSAFIDEGARVDRRALLRELLARTSGALDVGPTRDVPDWIHGIGERIRAQPGRAASLRDLAREIDVHPGYLARVFRSRFGCSAGDYVRRQRIDRATTLLMDTSDSLSSIALELGFCDQAHFSRAFHRETSCSPARFRRAAQAVHRSR